MSPAAREALETSLEVTFIALVFALYLYCLRRFDVDAGPILSDSPCSYEN